MAKPYLLIFPGQGTHIAGMGQYWAEESPIFGKYYHSLLNHFHTQYGVSLENIIVKHPEQLELTQWAQPAIYCYQVAAAHMLMDKKKASAIAGHSLGEFAAIVTAGGMDPHKTLELVTERGLLMQQTDPGKMIAALCPNDVITNILERHPKWACWISAENDENLTIVAGMPQDMDQLTHSLAYLGIRFLNIAVENAFHTPMMESISAEWKKLTDKVEAQTFDIPFYSSVDGKMHFILPKDYWFMHLFARVRFKQALNHLYRDFPEHVCIEVGPNNKFQSYLRKRWNLTASTGPEKSLKEIRIQLEELLYHS